MGKARLIPFQPVHSPEHAAHASSGPACTIVAGDEILAIGGVMRPWPNLGYLWFELQPAGKRQIRAVWPLIVREVAGWWRDLGLTRMEAHVDSADPAAIRTAQHLGLEREATMRKWGPGGRDHEMMVLVR